jgi:hypothetical protein
VAAVTAGRVPARRHPGGTTLVELLVVLALLSLMVLVAADLIVHSVKLIGAVGRAARNPLVLQVNERLRRDVQEAAWLLGGEEIWSEGPLVLRGQEGGRLRVALVGGELVRASEDAGGGAAAEQVLLRGVTAWWWRSPSPGVVDISYTHLTAPLPESRVSREPGFELERRTETLRLTIRGGGGGWRW